LPFPDGVALQVTGNLSGHDKRGRLLRRTVVRYMNASYVIKLAAMSPPVKKRFPSYRHLIEAGLLVEEEAQLLVHSEVEKPPYVVPLVWAIAICHQALKENRIDNIYAFHGIVDAIADFRGGLGFLTIYDWINIPMVYLQVVSVAIHSFFLAHLFGQHVVHDHHPGCQPSNSTLAPIVGFSSNVSSLGDSISGPLAAQTISIPELVHIAVQPYFVIFQFIFYMGWLKVAESLVNPFGEDDDDIEINWIIDRNRNISYQIVDDLHREHPELDENENWFDPIEDKLPLTLAAAARKAGGFEGSAANLVIPQEETAWICQLETIMEERPDKGTECGSSGQRNSVGEQSKTAAAMMMKRPAGVVEGRKRRRKDSEPDEEAEDGNEDEEEERTDKPDSEADSLERQCRDSSVIETPHCGAARQTIPAVLVTKKEMEKGRLSRVKGMPDPTSRLAEPTRLPRHILLKNKAEVFDSDSLASLAARKHRKDLECQVKRQAPRDQRDNFDDRMSQSSAPSGKAFLMSRLHQSLQTATQSRAPSTPDLNRNSNSEGVDENQSNERQVRRSNAQSREKDRFLRAPKRSRSGSLSPASSYSSIFHMSDLTSLYSLSSSARVDSRMKDLNFLAYSKGGLDRFGQIHGWRGRDMVSRDSDKRGLRNPGFPPRTRPNQTRSNQPRLNQPRHNQGRLYSTQASPPSRSLTVSGDDDKGEEVFSRRPFKFKSSAEAPWSSTPLPEDTPGGQPDGERLDTPHSSLDSTVLTGDGTNGTTETTDMTPMGSQPRS